MKEKDTELSFGRYGTKAETIYKQGCKNFGWKELDIGFYGLQQSLYSKNSAGDNLSVWFIAHSDWTESNNKQFKNTLGLFAEIITEEYKIGLIPNDNDNTDRIVFA